MSDPVACPSCGRAMVYHSNLHRYQCHPCAIDERDKAEEKERVPLPWWMWLILIIVFLIIIILLVALKTDTGGLVNATQSAEGLGDTVAAHWAGLAYLVVLVAAVVVAYILKGGRERCPHCGKVLKQTPNGHYYCMRCRKMYDPEDIEVEVVE